MEMRIRRGDIVVVLSGVEKGKQGKVIYASPKTRTVVVEKLNLIKRHTKPGRGGIAQGGIVEKEAPMPVSKVALVAPKTGEATRVRREIGEDGSRIRVSVRSGEPIEVRKE
jgi:large subunit ribosomal protein L24